MDIGAFSYFPITYYSRFYFPTLEAAATPASAGRDRDVFRALQSTLLATGAFDCVLLHRQGDSAETTADRNPTAIVRRTDWIETNIANPTTIERTVNFEVVIALRGDDPEARFEALERLENLALNALDGRNWAGITLYDKSALRRGYDDPAATHPEARVILKGNFTYILEGYCNRSIDP